MEKMRCHWVGTNPMYVKYHDEEWGVPVHSDRVHFEFLILEGAQAGLSWSTILKRRESYRKAFSGFDPAIVSNYDEEEIEKLLKDSGIIRNRQKILSAINNARAFLEIQKEFGSFDFYIWSFVGGKPMVNHWKKVEEIPAYTKLSIQLSKDLKKRGFSFVGPIIVYAYMQAVGLVNDHLVNCFRHKELQLLY